MFSGHTMKRLPQIADERALTPGDVTLLRSELAALNTDLADTLPASTRSAAMHALVTILSTESPHELHTATLELIDLAAGFDIKPADVPAAAAAFVGGLDGTYAKTWATVASELRARGDIPTEVSSTDLADLVEAVDAAGLLTP